MLASLLVAVAVTARCAAAAAVFAHFMVQNTYSYGVTDWKNEMNIAKQTGIDGFALNWIPPYCQVPDLRWQMDRIDDAFTAADSVGFHLFYSFDMSYASGSGGCPTNQAWDVTNMTAQIKKYVGRNSLYSINYEPVVSTYAGEAYGNTFFQNLKSALGSTTIRLVPAMTTYSYASSSSSDASGATTSANNVLSAYPAIDGFLNWQAWPFDGNTNLTGDADKSYKTAFSSANRKGPVIMAVSPWQFKDLNSGNLQDSWVQYSDYLFPQHWEAAIKTVKPEVIEILTWNDFPESHYISNLPPTDSTAPEYAQLGNFGNYIYGHGHSAWRVMANYYINWYKAGGTTAPASTKDQLVFWYRVHPKSAKCANGATSIRNSAYPADAVIWWAVVKSTATIVVNVGSQTRTTTVTGTGPTSGMVPFPTSLGTGVKPTVKISRGGSAVYSATGSMAIATSCSWQDFNPVVGLAGAGL